MRLAAGQALIIVNAHKTGAERMAADIAQALDAEGWSTRIFSFYGKPSAHPDFSNIDIGMTLGGDGTVLYGARAAAPCGVPLLPINMGSLGFIAWVKRSEWLAHFRDAVNGRLNLSARFMLDVLVSRQGTTVADFRAMNDGVISGFGPAKIVNLSISVSGASLGTYRSDGIIVATPTGSTAYSLAAGGPILDPDMDAMVFNPICPFTLSNRPLVVPGGETIEVYVERGQREHTMLTVDGQDSFELQEGDRVMYRRAAWKALLYCAPRGSFYQILRAKLNWSGGPDA
jgi:NAD+ kinase